MEERKRCPCETEEGMGPWQCDRAEGEEGAQQGMAGTPSDEEQALGTGTEVGGGKHHNP